MIDKVGIKIDPKHTIFIQIGDTLPDILPLLQTALTGHKNPDNRPETLHKIRLSISIGVSEKRSSRHAENEPKAKTGMVFLSE